MADRLPAATAFYSTGINVLARPEIPAAARRRAPDARLAAFYGDGSAGLARRTTVKRGVFFFFFWRVGL